MVRPGDPLTWAARKWENSGKTMEDNGKTMGRQWENNGRHWGCCKWGECKTAVLIPLIYRRSKTEEKLWSSNMIKCFFVGQGNLGQKNRVVLKWATNYLWYILRQDKIWESTWWTLLGKAGCGTRRLRAGRSFRSKDLFAEDDEVLDQDVHLISNWINSYEIFINE